MKGIQKIAISLLITVVLFSGFTFFAFSGLFDYIETSFFIERIENSTIRGLDAIATEYGDYSEKLRTVLSTFSFEPTIKNSFLLNQSREDIFTRQNLVQTLQNQFPEIQIIRIVDPQGVKIHYSTLESDIISRSDSSIEYGNYDELAEEPGFNIQEFTVENEFRVYQDYQRNYFIHIYKIVDDFNLDRGFILFYVSSRGLERELLTRNLINIGDSVQILEGRTIYINALGGHDTGFVDNINVLRNSGSRTKLEDSSGAEFVLFASDENEILTVLPEDIFSMQIEMKIVLLVSFFATTYLLIFLILNVRQDSILVVADRVKRFQIALLNEYLEKKDEIDWKRWSKELEYRRDEVRDQIKRGVGKGQKSEQLDQLIDKSWDEIIDIVSKKQIATSESQVDLKKLEGIIEKVVSNIQILAPESSAVAEPRKKIVKAKADVSSPQPLTPVEVEELEDVADVDEVEELGEVEELEEVDDASAVPLGQPVEVEEIEELEDAAAVDEVEEFGEVGELEEVVDAGEVSMGQPVKVEEIEELEDTAALDEVEEIEGVVEVDTSKLDHPADVEEVADVDELEEVEAVATIQPVGIEEIEEFAEAAEIEEFSAVDEAIEEAIEEVDELEEIEELEEVEALEDFPRMEVVEELGSDDLEELVAEEKLHEESEPEELEELEVSDNLEELSSFEAGEALELLEVESGAEEFEEGLDELEIVAAEEGSGELQDLEGPSKPISYGLFSFASSEHLGYSKVTVLDAGEIEFKNREQYERLIDREIIQIRTLQPREKATELVDSSGEIVQEESGLLTISDSVYASSKAVLQKTDDESISHLFGDDALDFSSEFDFSQDIGTSSVHFTDQYDKIPLIDGQVDYDKFLEKYNKSLTGIAKSLVEITRSLGATIGMLLDEKDGGYGIYHSIGLSPYAQERFAVDSSSPLMMNFHKKHLVVINGHISVLHDMKKMFNEQDDLLAESSLFIPVRFEGKDAYIYCGFKYSSVNIDEIIKKLV